MDINGKVAIVTGGASGIGRATAIALAREGARGIVIADIDEEMLHEAHALVSAAGDAQALTLPTDVTDVASLKHLFRRAEETFGRIDIVHNNAGLTTSMPQWPDMPIERVALLADVNFKGVLLGTRLAVDSMRKSGGGAIVNTASVAAHNPGYGEAVYGATKAAVVFFTRACAGLNDAHHIRVNAVCPGITDTPMLNKTGDGSRPADWLMPALARITPIAPEQIAAAVLVLITDDTKVAEIVDVQNTARETRA